VITHDVRGEGALLVLLHSGGMSGRQWRRLAERLAPSYRVVSQSMRPRDDVRLAATAE